MMSQENCNLCGKRQPTDIYTEIRHVLELSDTDFKAAMIKRFHNEGAKTLQQMDR